MSIGKAGRQRSTPPSVYTALLTKWLNLHKDFIHLSLKGEKLQRRVEMLVAGRCDLYLVQTCFAQPVTFHSCFFFSIFALDGTTLTAIASNFTWLQKIKFHSCQRPFTLASSLCDASLWMFGKHRVPLQLLFC